MIVQAQQPWLTAFSLNTILTLLSAGANELEGVDESNSEEQAGAEAYSSCWEGNQRGSRGDGGEKRQKMKTIVNGGVIQYYDDLDNF